MKNNTWSRTRPRKASAASSPSDRGRIPPSAALAVRPPALDLPPAPAPPPRGGLLRAEAAWAVGCCACPAGGARGAAGRRTPLHTHLTASLQRLWNAVTSPWMPYELLCTGAGLFRMRPERGGGIPCAAQKGRQPAQPALPASTDSGSVPAHAWRSPGSPKALTSMRRHAPTGRGATREGLLAQAQPLPRPPLQWH